MCNANRNDDDGTKTTEEKQKYKKKKKKERKVQYIEVYKCRLVKFEGFGKAKKKYKKRIGQLCGFRDHI